MGVRTCHLNCYRNYSFGKRSTGFGIKWYKCRYLQDLHKTVKVQCATGAPKNVIPDSTLSMQEFLC